MYVRTRIYDFPSLKAASRIQFLTVSSWAVVSPRLDSGGEDLLSTASLNDGLTMTEQFAAFPSTSLTMAASIWLKACPPFLASFGFVSGGADGKVAFQ